MPDRSISLPNIHAALEQLGYRLLEEDDGKRYYQLLEYPGLQPIILDFSELATIGDIQRALQENGENADAFFAMYESL